MSEIDHTSVSSTKPTRASSRNFTKWYILGGSISFFIIVTLFGPTLYAKIITSSYRYDANNASVQSLPDRDVAIVFGAGVYKDGSLSRYLKDRLDTAITLYKTSKVKKLLVTGDNSNTHYNEPVAMANYAQKQGVPKSDVVLDYAGLDTYDSCWRAVHIFKIKNAVLVTQGYHLPRAVLLCRSLGIDALGIAARRSGSDSTINYTAREWLATDQSVLQILLKPHATIGGKPEPIKLR